MSDTDDPVRDIDVLHSYHGTDCDDEGEGHIVEELDESPTGGRINVVTSNARSSFAGKSRAVYKHA